MMIRLALGFAAGAILGLERSSRHQVAGLRTHILIALGATLLMLLSIWVPQELMGGDPGRIAAQVVSGIGFLGAGAIIRLGNNIRGLTTAASLWFAAAVGLAIGAGMFIAAAIAEILGFFTLLVLAKLERRIFPSELNKVVEIIYNTGSAETDEILAAMRSFNIRINSMDVVQGSKSKKTKLRLMAGIPSTIDITTIAQSIKSLKSVMRVEIKEKY